MAYFDRYSGIYVKTTKCRQNVHTPVHAKWSQYPRWSRSKLLL